MIDHCLSDTFSLTQLVIQPTSACNLNCKYCYIPKELRDTKSKIDLNLIRKVSEAIPRIQQIFPGQIELLWHAGEPLSAGLKNFESYMQFFERHRTNGSLIHSIQTNATLINTAWCHFFREYDFNIGVSLDGPGILNLNRVTKIGTEAYPLIIRGLNLLKMSGLSFGIVAVISMEHLVEVNNLKALADQLFNFFVATGAKRLGLNFEEKENSNIKRKILDDERVTEFWFHLYQIWSKSRTLDIRELNRSENWLLSMGNNNSHSSKTNLIPTISQNGDVYFLSPELCGLKSKEYKNFVVGNLFEQDLVAIIESAKDCAYVQDFLEGAGNCRNDCPLGHICNAGSTASSKVTENGDLRSTETAYCRNVFIRPTRAVLSSWHRDTANFPREIHYD